MKLIERISAAAIKDCKIVVGDVIIMIEGYIKLLDEWQKIVSPILQPALQATGNMLKLKVVIFRDISPHSIVEIPKGMIEDAVDTINSQIVDISQFLDEYPEEEGLKKALDEVVASFQ